MSLGRFLSGVFLVACILAVPSGGRAQSFTVPDGFEVADSSSEPGEPGLQPLLRVQPASGTFSELSSLTLSEITRSVEDPNEWLESRVTVEAGSRENLEEFLDSPDSPFGSPAFDPLRSFLPRLYEGLTSLGRAPLAFCDAPIDIDVTAGNARELACTFKAGPFQRFLVYRLQQVGDRTFYIRIDSVNERRLRHLKAIANSFDLTS